LELKKLDRKLNHKGLLIIDQTDFDFQETSIAFNYLPLDFQQNKITRERPLYNKENKKVANTHSCFRVFAKQN
jgi:hypothetical protein